MNKKIIIGLCILTLIITACNGSQTSTSDIIDIDYRSGTSGIGIEFLENLPPSETFEGAPIVLAARIKNNGGYEARNGELKLIGFDPLYFELKEDERFDKIPLLGGKELTNPQGDEHIAEFQVKNIRIPFAAKSFEVPYILQVAYDYETIASQDICVNTNIYTDLSVDSKSCEVQKTISLSSQGSPIHITKIEQQVLPGSETATLRYTITLKNSGKGKVIGPVRLSEARVANKRLICKQREIKDFQTTKQPKVFICETTQPANTNFLSSMSVSVVYRYQETQKGKFSIKRFVVENT